MHSSRMRTARSFTVCHTPPPPTMHAPMDPPVTHTPHAPPAMHASCHACPLSRIAPPPRHACPLLRTLPPPVDRILDTRF